MLYSYQRRVFHQFLLGFSDLAVYFLLEEWVTLVQAQEVFLCAYLVVAVLGCSSDVLEALHWDRWHEDAWHFLLLSKIIIFLISISDWFIILKSLDSVKSYWVLKNIFLTKNEASSSLKNGTKEYFSYRESSINSFIFEIYLETSSDGMI